MWPIPSTPCTTAAVQAPQSPLKALPVPGAARGPGGARLQHLLHAHQLLGLQPDALAPGAALRAVRARLRAAAGLYAQQRAALHLRARAGPPRRELLPSAASGRPAAGSPAARRPRKRKGKALSALRLCLAV